MMSKAQVTEMYTMTDLIPIVWRLAQEFTAGESSSVTYERARQFMEAALYCIAHVETKDRLVSVSGVLPAEEAYRLGLAAVKKKVWEAREKYGELMKIFDCYDNRNYRDTVVKALPGFFRYYDVKFAPMETIITMDYPMFGLDVQLRGIDRISQYLDAIWKEQCYLKQFPRAAILAKLRSFHPHFEQEFFNVREIIELPDR